MAENVNNLFHWHSANPVHETFYRSSTNKRWAQAYDPISRVHVHTHVDADGSVQADFESCFLPELADDRLRMAAFAFPPNYRRWRLDTEGDIVNWFNTEVSNVVLPAWSACPALLQTAEAKPLSAATISQCADTTFSVKPANTACAVAIGEMKRNLIEPDDWCTGSIEKSSQKTLSRELRGYADKYECPQLFVFDGATLVILQFRARNKEEVKHPGCEVDCWVIPRNNPGGCSLRYALHRLLVQGFRRCQGWTGSQQQTVGGVRMAYREFYTGRPVWDLGGQLRLEHPTHTRVLDADSGAFYMSRGAERLWETAQFWAPEMAQRQLEVRGGDATCERMATDS
ncbi:Uncharacterized protein TPAR_04311 [Tolypocladium paradoxum]|uniref:Uncharacterized protein n=1 Tax=Tolypocladium paradoxum TaxID=94208 RepID=A0A2S4KZ79_9HYPO|nr:Uncharacterized protein TPAR_04311 [Tolypocladium paradoxum]